MDETHLSMSFNTIFAVYFIVIFNSNEKDD